MALKVADRVRENTSSTGTGGISFTGSPAGFQTFSSVLTSGDITYYTIEENDKWEVGIGTYGSSNLERDYILGSSNSGNKISLGGSGTVFITYPAEKSVYRNQESQAVVGASGLVFDNGTIIKDAKITELYDVNVSGTPASTHLLSFDVTNKGLLIGDSTGPSNNGNILIGHGAGSGVTSASQSVIIGAEAAVKNQTGSQNVHIGYQSGPVAAGSSSVVYNTVSVGYQAGHKMRHNSTAIGHQAGIDAYEIGFVAMGYQAASGIGSYSVAVGMEAGKSYNDNYATIIGYQAGYNGGGVDSIWVGRGAGHSSAGAARSVGIGKEAGKSSTANDSIYIGKSAGQSNTSNDLLFIGNASPSSMGTLIKGDMDSKRVAIGNADITLSDTFHVGINTATDKGIIVKSAAAQSADLTQWVNASDSILASVSNSGVISANGLVASGAGLQVTDSTPAVTSNTLYSVGGGLYWNGSPLAGGGGTVTPAQLNYVSGIAVYASGEVGSGDVTTDQLNYVSGIAVYSSGQAIANESDISTNVTNITATTSVANYASGVVTGGIPTFGNMYVDEYIYHNGDTNTSIRFQSDVIDLRAGNWSMVKIDQDNNKVTVNNSNQNVDFRVNSDDGTQLIRTDATNNRVGIGTGSPSYQLDVVGHDAWMQASGIIVGNSGIVLASNTPSVTTNTLYNDGGALKFNGSAIGEGDVTTDQLNYVSGIAVYSSGQAIANEVDIAVNVSDISTNTSNISANTSNISTNTTNITSATNTANYASGQAIDNEGDIVAVSGIAAYASGHAHDDLYVSGVAAYASGNTSNIVFGSNVEGDILYHNGTSFTRLPKGTDSHVLTMDGNVPAWEAATGGGGDVTTAQLVYVSGIAVYGSGQAESLNYASGVAAYASGNSLTNATNIATNAADIVTASGALRTSINTNASNISTNTTNITAATSTANYASGEALSLTYASGLTATNASNITTNASDIVAVSGIAHYASGHAHDDLYVSGVAAYASGQVNVTTDGTAEASKALILDANKSFSGVKNGRLNQFDSWLYSSGVNVGNSGVVLANNTPPDTDNTLYNVAGTLYFNGTQLASAGGASPTAQYASGEALSLTYASGLTATNASNISTNTTNITAATNTANYASGEALSLTYASGLTATNATNITAATNTANYASGEALSLTYASGLTATNASNIAIVSGVAYNIFSITAGDGSDYTIDGMGLNSAADPTMYLHKGHSYTFNKTFSGHPFRVSATEGGSVYQDADGNNIEIGSAADEVRFEVPQDAPDKLYYYCTAHPSSMKGVIYTTTNVDEIVHVSGIAAYASGQALSLTYASGLTATNASNIVATSGIANYASGQALSLTYASGLTATNAANISTNTTNITAATNTANYASGQALSLTYASGLTATNASNISTNTTNITAATNTANYASGEALSLNYASGVAAYASGQAIENEGIAAYASGNTSNIAFGSNAEGDILYHDGTSFTRLAKGTDNHVLTMDGNVPNWEAATSSTTNASGAIYQVQYNADGANFGGDAGFTWTTDGQGGAFTNDHVLAVSGTIIAYSGDANWANPVSIGSGATIKGDNAIAIGHLAKVGGVHLEWTANDAVAIGNGVRIRDANGIAIGKNAYSENGTISIGKDSTGVEGIAIGDGTSVGASNAIGIGDNADAGDGTINIGGPAMGSASKSVHIGTAGLNLNGWSNTVSIGQKINYTASNTTADYTTIVGTKAAYIAGYDSTRASLFGAYSAAQYGSIAIGYEANAAGPFAVGIGYKVVAPEKHFVVASGSAQTSVLLSGVFGSHLSLPNGQQFIQMATAAQTTDLMQWQDSAGTNVASMTPSGVLNAYQIRTSGNEVCLGPNAGCAINAVAILGTAGNNAVSIGSSSAATGTNGVAVGVGASASDGVGVGNSADAGDGVAIGNGANTNNHGTAIGRNADAGSVGSAVAIGVGATTSAESGHSIGAYATSAKHATAIGPHADALGERSVAIGKDAQAHGTSWVIASGNTSAEVGISGVFGSYVAIPNDQKLAVGGNVPTYTVDALGHDAWIRATGVIVGNSGIVLSDNVPTDTDFTLYRDGSDLKWNGSAIGGSATAAGAIHQIQYNSDGTNFGADAQFLFAKNNAAFTNDRVFVMSGVIIANSGDANYANPVSIGSGAYVTCANAVVIGGEARSVGVTAGATAVGVASQAAGGSVAIGYGASSNTHNSSVAIGGSALANSEKCVAIGKAAQAADGGVSVGNGAGSGGGGPHSHAICIGEASSSASYTITMGGDSSTAEQFGMAIGYNSHSRGYRGVAYGPYASAGQHSVALGNRAVAPDGGFVVASGSALTDVLLSGVMKDHLTMPNGQQFRQMATAAQTSDLMQWQNSAGTNVASMTPSGILNAYEIRTSGYSVCLGLNAQVSSIGAGQVALLGTATGAGSVAIGGGASASHAYSVVIGGSASSASQESTIVGRTATGTGSESTAFGYNANAGSYAVAVGKNTNASVTRATAIGRMAEATAVETTAVGSMSTATQFGANTLGSYSDALGERSVAIGYEAQAHGTSWVIASGDTSAEVGISGVFGSYAAIPNDQKLAVGGNVPTYTVDALGHGAMVRATGVIVGNSGIVLASNAPSVTTNTLYNDGGTLSFNGSAVGGGSTTNASGAIYQVQYNADGANFGADPGFWRTTDGQGGVLKNSHILAVSGTIIANSGDAAYDNPVSIGSGAYVAGNSAVSIGKSANVTAADGVAVGPSASAAQKAVSVGHYSLATALYAISIGRSSSASAQGGVSIGWHANSAYGDTVLIGPSAHAYETACVAVGTTSSAGQHSVAIGHVAQANDHKSVAIGNYANASNHAVALGSYATAPEGGFVLASGSALTDVLLSGVMKTHLTMPNGQQFIQMATAAQTTDLMQWQNSAGTNVASMTPSGVLNVYDVRTSGEDVWLGWGANGTANARSVVIGYDAEGTGTDAVAIGNASESNVTYGVAIGSYAEAGSNGAIGIGRSAHARHGDAISIGQSSEAGSGGVTVGRMGNNGLTDGGGDSATAIGYNVDAGGPNAVALGAGANAAGHSTIALGHDASSPGDYGVAIGNAAVSHEQTWVIASGATAASVGVSGVFGSYAAIPNDQKLAVGGNVPTYTVDALGHGAVVRGSGVIVGNSGIVLASNTPSVTTNTLYNAGGTLSFNGSAVGGGGAAPASGSIYEVQYNGDGTNLGADSDFTWNPSTNVMTVTGHISASTKSFLIDHPTKPDKKLQYACLEGPENGVYVRGHTNDNLIDLPDYWTALVDPESITVQLTAKDAPQPFLYVSGVLNNQVHLISDREISAYYVVNATRKDVEPLLVEPGNYRGE